MSVEKYSELPARQTLPFVQARYYSKGRSLPILAIVIHTAECLETPSAAENVAAYFAGPNAPKASAHYCVDCDSVVQCVRDDDTAWHAGPVNGWTIGIELAGKAGQGDAGWQDEFSQRTLSNAAELVAVLCTDNGIPIVRLTPEQVKARELGMFGHHDVTVAYGHKGGHWDPGPTFPWQAFIDLAKAYQSILQGES